jgi:hypothetical protein
MSHLGDVFDYAIEQGVGDQIAELAARGAVCDRVLGWPLHRHCVLATVAA